MYESLIIKRKVRFVIAGGLLVLPMLVSAATSSITIKVTVVAPPPCTINDNKPIEVDFGDVITTQIDGNNYLMPVNFSVTCTKPYETGINIQVSGNPASFDSKVLGTTINGLGIVLKTDVGIPGKILRFNINEWWSGFYPNNPWKFWAAPVKQSGINLRGGDFTAGATMRVAYP